MTAPVASIDIVNLALDYLGEEPAKNVETPTSQTEKIMARWYDATRETCLREYAWNFAKERVVLMRTGTPAFDYSDAYEVPADCLRVVSIGGDIEERQIRDYDYQGREILVDNNGSNSLKLRYIKNVTDVSKFDSLFVDYLALKLALKVAQKFTQRRSVITTMNEMLGVLTPKIISINGQEKPIKRVQRSRYLSARRYNTRRRDDLYVFW